MNTQTIAKLIFISSAQLASVSISLTNELLERLAKARGIAFAGDAALPARVVLARQRLGNFQKPLFVLGVFPATLAGRFFHFLCPCCRYFARNCWAFAALHGWLGYTFQSFAHGLFAFGCTLIGWSLFQGSRGALVTTFDAATNWRTTINTQVWFLAVNDFSHVTSIV